MTNRAAFPPGNAREDWSILRALSDKVGHKLPYDSLDQLRVELYAAYPHFAALDAIKTGDSADLVKLAGTADAQVKGAFVSPIKDFYLTNAIARASKVMAECSALAQGVMAQAAE